MNKKKRKQFIFARSKYKQRSVFFVLWIEKKKKTKQFLKLEIKRFLNFFTTFLFVSCVLFFYFFCFNRIDSVMYLSLIFQLFILGTWQLCVLLKQFEGYFVFCVCAFAWNALQLPLFFFLSFSTRFWTDWQNLFFSICPIVASSACDQDRS